MSPLLWGDEERRRPAPESGPVDLADLCLSAELVASLARRVRLPADPVRRTELLAWANAALTQATSVLRLLDLETRQEDR
jgi:hypothetical protein